MYLLTKDGIKETPKRKRIKSLFCKHQNRISGVHCSENGLVRISGVDEYTVCAECGTILEESHHNY